MEGNKCNGSKPASQPDLQLPDCRAKQRQSTAIETLRDIHAATCSTTMWRCSAQCPHTAPPCGALQPRVSRYPLPAWRGVSGEQQPRPSPRARDSSPEQLHRNNTPPSIPVSISSKPPWYALPPNPESLPSESPPIANRIRPAIAPPRIPQPPPPVNPD